MSNDVPEAAPRWSDLVSGEAAAPFIALFGGVALHAVYLFVTVTALPSIVAEIGGLALYAWVTTCFTVGSIAASAAAPVVSARWGARTTFVASLALFALGSLVCALAPTMPALIVGRLLQGIGGGALPALAYANIQTALPPGLRSRAIAAVSGVWGMAALTGPLIGGLFAQHLGWRGVFYMPLALAAALVIVARSGLGVEAAPTRRPLPLARLALLSLAVLAVAAGSVPGTFAASAAGIALGGGLFGWMLLLDRRGADPLLPTRAFDPRHALGAAAVTMGGLTFALSAAGFAPYVLQRAQGVSALTAGYIEAGVTIAWTIAALATAHVTGRAQGRLTVLAPTLAALGSLGAAGGFWAGSVAVVTGAMALVGAGIGVGWAHLGNTMVQHAEADQRDLTAAFINTNQLIAMAFGSSLAGVLLNVVGFATAHDPASVGRCGVVLFAGFALAPLLGALVIAARPRAEAA